MQPKQGALIKFLLKSGIAKNESAANTILIVVLVAVIGLTFFIMFGGNSGTPTVPTEEPIVLE